MAKPDETILPGILDAALKDFSECGFEKASTNKICSEAGVTTGALFKRFASKDELFQGLVGEVADTFKKHLISAQGDFHSMESEEKMKSAIRPDDNPSDFLTFIYDNFDIFYLLLVCAKGSSYENYMDELIDILIQSTEKFIKDVNINPMIEGSPITHDTIHILVSSYLYGLFEPVAHKMTYEEAERYTRQIKYLFDAGWSSILKSQ